MLYDLIIEADFTGEARRWENVGWYVWMNLIPNGTNRELLPLVVVHLVPRYFAFDVLALHL